MDTKDNYYEIVQTEADASVYFLFTQTKQKFIYVVYYYISMSLFSLREFHSKYVVFMYLYDNGGELILASNYLGTLTPLFAREFATKASMDDVFFFEDITLEIQKLLSDVSSFIKNESVSFFIALASRAITVDLIEIKHKIEDVRIISLFKKEHVWEMHKNEIIKRMSQEGSELFEFHILHESFATHDHPEYRAHVAYGGMPRRMLAGVQSIRRMIHSALPQSASMLLSKQVLMSYLHESFHDDKEDRLFIDLARDEITILGVIQGVSSLFIHRRCDNEKLINDVILYLQTDYETFKRMIDLHRLGLLEEGKAHRLISGLKKSLEDPLYSLLKKGHTISLAEFVIQSEITTTCFQESYSYIFAEACKSLLSEYYGLARTPSVNSVTKEVKLFEKFHDKRILDVVLVFDYLSRRAL